MEVIGQGVQLHNTTEAVCLLDILHKAVKPGCALFIH